MSTMNIKLEILVKMLKDERVSCKGSLAKDYQGFDFNCEGNEIYTYGHLLGTIDTLSRTIALIDSVLIPNK